MSYESRILSLSPVLYLPLTETSGTSFADLTGNSHTGTGFGTIAGGTAGPALGESACVLPVAAAYSIADPVYFYSIASYLSVDNPSTIPVGGSAYSYELWIKASRISNDNFFIDTWKGGDGNAFLQFNVEDAIVAYSSNGFFGSPYSDGQIPPLHGGINRTCWTHLCWTWNHTSQLFYVNGLPHDWDDSVTIVGGDGFNVGWDYYSFVPDGCVLANTSPYLGLPDFQTSMYVNHFAVYDYALTATQVNDNYHAIWPRQDGPCFTDSIFPNPPPAPPPDIAILARVYRNRIDTNLKKLRS